MRYDDRLVTVLRQRADGERAARTQFRQLLDLIGSRAPASGPTSEEGDESGPSDDSLLAAARLRLEALADLIPAPERAAMLRDPGLRLRDPRLIADLADGDPEIALAALERAQLDAEEWTALVPQLPVRARGFLRLRRDLPPATDELLERLGIHDRALPRPTLELEPLDLVEEAPVTIQPLPANDDARADAIDAIGPAEDSTISALVRRIEAYRLARRDSSDAPRLPLGEADEAAPACDAIGSFAFTAGAQGRIDWADPVAAAMVIGTRLTGDAAALALRFHQPLRRAPMSLEGAPAISGPWLVEAMPRFTRADGRFFGYAGMFRRAPDLSTDETVADRSLAGEADRLRQLLHELRTPANAIQGFAEVIQQQLFGPAPHEYRALAAGIASDGARMLAGFDELDRLARLETGALEIERGACDFGAVVGAQLAQLDELLAQRTSGFEYAFDRCGDAAIAHPEAEALAWRLLATLASTTGAGEWLQIELEEHQGMLRLGCELPALLAAEDDIFAAEPRPSSGALSAGMFGAGFSLRLARAEAIAAGGGLERVDDWLMLSLPLLTASGQAPSHAGSSAA